MLRHAEARTPLAAIETPDLERMKWYGFFYRKRDTPGRYMNRIRITAGELTSDQAREIAAIAYEHGHGIVDVATRAVKGRVEERVPLRPWPDLPAPAPAARNDDLVGWFPQSEPDRWTMGLCVPLGRLSWRQLEALAVLAKRWGDGQLRTTHEQGLAVINIPGGFRDAAATEAAAVGLSMHADTLARNTVACTGTQFCNIAVTETKGAMFRLVETLRQRMLALHGIRIHMSGCPSSCAQHFTADIGLKGVRVRRLVGTREGFDVYLGGGVAGDVHLGLRYKLGVDVDQLPLVIEEVVNEYYIRHRAGQTFSAYWRARLREDEAAKVGEDDYRPATWICERCDYSHLGEDPPVFCPGCAGVRRLFARVEDAAESPSVAAGRATPARDDGFVFAAREDALGDGAILCRGLIVAMAAKLLFEAALFRHLASRSTTSLKRTAWLMTGVLSNVILARFAAGLLGGLAMPGLLLLSRVPATAGHAQDLVFVVLVAMLFLACLAGELLERYLFFAAVASPRMPGTL